MKFALAILMLVLCAHTTSAWYVTCSTFDSYKRSVSSRFGSVESRAGSAYSIGICAKNKAYYVGRDVASMKSSVSSLSSRVGSVESDVKAVKETVNSLNKCAKAEDMFLCMFGIDY